MRRAGALLLALLLTFTLPAAGDHGGLAITEVLPDPADGDREFIEIHNTGAASVNLEGYLIEDAAGNNFTFPAWSLAAGGHVVVWGGGAGDGVGPAWSRSAVWNNGGDTATLRDPSGTVLDQVAYGSGTPGAAPHNASAPAPPTGRSLAWDGSAWRDAEPTPGTAYGASGTPAVVTVENVPPTVDLSGTAAWAAPGEPFTVVVGIDDGNGVDDIASWTLWSDGAVAAQGTQPPGTVSLPGHEPGNWTLRLQAADQAGAEANTTHQITVRDSPVSVAGGEVLTFPPLRPGDADVTSLVPIELRNDDTEPHAPMFDASPFQGPSVIPVDGNLRLGWDTGGDVAWSDYDGPLTQLPSIPPGGTARLWLQIAAVPDGLPAGAYGTTFAVVP